MLDDCIHIVGEATRFVPRNPEIGKTYDLILAHGDTATDLLSVFLNWDLQYQPLGIVEPTLPGKPLRPHVHLTYGLHVGRKPRKAVQRMLNRITLNRRLIAFHALAGNAENSLASIGKPSRAFANSVAIGQRFRRNIGRGDHLVHGAKPRLRTAAAEVPKLRSPAA